MNTIILIICTLLLILWIYKYYLTDNFKYKMKKLLFTLALLSTLTSCSMMKDLNTALRTPTNVKTYNSTTVVNGQTYHTNTTINGHSYKVTTTGNSINSVTYGHY